MVHVADAERIRGWMFDTALPFWAERGIDRVHGGYVERLTLDGQDLGAAFKRTRVACRQVYVFSHGHELGWNRGRELASPGIDYLIKRAWQGEEKGFARSLTRAGDVLDSTADLYDHAFVLFAFAWHYRVSADKRSHDWMHRTLDFIETRMRHTGGRGFWHAMPASGWRQQNPHMHLTEACIAAYQATGEARFKTVALELVQLFGERFLDSTSGALGEYFDDDWGRAPGDKGLVTEPGHQMEWAWILNACQKEFGLDLKATIRKCLAFGERHGVDPASRAVYNEVRADGFPLDRGSRAWPNTERLKGAIALHEVDGVNPAPVIAETSALLFDRYFAEAVPGTWIDAFDENGRRSVDNVPASTFYHVFLAFAEVLRIAN